MTNLAIEVILASGLPSNTSEAAYCDRCEPTIRTGIPTAILTEPAAIVWLHRRLGTWPPDAEDLLQRTSLVLWRNFEQFQPGTDFFRWSSRVAFLEVQDFLKRKRRRVVFSSQMVSELAEVLVGESQRWESRRDALSGCIEKLRPTDRDLVEQCYAGRQSFKDVAKGSEDRRIAFTSLSAAFARRC